MEVIEREKCDVVWHYHPALAANRNVYQCVVGDGSTVREILIRSGVDTKQPIVIWLDDRLLEVVEWDLICPKAGQIINVKATVMGGGGGGGSNPLQTVAMIALVVAVTYFTMGTANGFMGAYTAAGFGLTAFEGAMVAGAVMMAGSMMINAVFAANNPGASMSNMSGQYAEASPTYSLSGGSNRMRPYESMPVVMGTHRLFPDLGAKPYVEYQGEDQYLHQIFHLGLSSCQFTDWKIGNTLVSSYQDVTWSYQNGSGQITAFPGNVDSAQGADLLNSSGWVTRTTSENTYRIGIDIEGVLYYANNNGGLDATSVQLRVQYREVGSSNWIDPAYITTQGNGFSAGHYESYQAYIEQWGYDENGYSDQSYTETRTRFVAGGGTVVISGNSQKPRRATLFIDVPVGTYEVRVIRDTADTTDARLQNKTSWSSLRSYQQDTSSYIGQNRVGLTIRASSQLNGAISQLSTTAAANAYYWNGSSWVFGQTSNPAHWFMDFASGRRDQNGKLLYGIGLSSSQLDLPTLNAWASFCVAEGFSFNAVIDGNMNASDLLSAIARCGFASPTWSSGKLGVIWDARNQNPVAAFGMSNIIQGSFEVSYITEQLAEEIIVRYEDPEKDYNQDEVRVLVPNVTTPTRTSTIDVFGCTNKAMAGKFANRLAAQQHYRRRRIKWDCDFEGFVCTRGDVVLLSHDLTQWGYSGRVVGFVQEDGYFAEDYVEAGYAEATSTSKTKIQLDRSVPRNGQVEYVMLKRPDGTMTTYQVVASSIESDVITLTTEPVFQDGMQMMDHIWFFSPLATPGKKVKILSVQPQSESRVQVIATDEDPEFYAAWDGTWTEPAPKSLLLSGKPVVSNLSIQESLYKKAAGIVSRVIVSFSVNGIFDRANIRYKIDDGAWISGFTQSGSYEFDATQTGQLTVEVCPVSSITAGEVVSKVITLYGLTIPPADVTSLTAYISDNGAIVTFDPCPDVDWAYTEIRSGDTWDTATPIVKALSNKYSDGWLPAGVKKYLARNVDTTGNISVGVASTSISISPPSAVNINRAEVQENSVALGWGDSKTSQPISGYAIYIGNEGQSFEQCTLYGKAGADSRSDIVIFRSAGRKVIWMTATDVAGNTSAPLGINVAVTLPTNFVLANEYDFNWTLGDVVNGDIDGGSLYLPIKSETWQTHFSSRGYTTIQDQINAGYPSYFQPSETTGSYTELHDIGKVISSATISVTPIATILSGLTTPDIFIEWSLDGVAWSNSGHSVAQTQATNLRYVRVTYSVTAVGGDDLVRLDRIHVVVSTTTVSEFGTLTLNPADVSGTPYTCNKEFLDIISAVATPNNSANIKTINVIISDSTSPQKILVQAWDASNNRTGGTVSINIGGY